MELRSIDEIDDVADTDGDGKAVYEEYVVRDMYHHDFKITDTVKAADVAEDKLYNIDLCSVESVVYNGQKQGPKVVYDGKTLQEGVDYTWKDWGDSGSCVEPGEYEVTLFGKGRFAGNVQVRYTIKPAPISKAKVTLAKTSYVYDGKAKKPAVKSVVLDGKTLKAGADYTVSYKNNVNVGTATVTITGTGGYTGTTEVTFSIRLGKAKISTLANTNARSISVKWTKVPGAKKYQTQWRKRGGKWKTKTIKSTMVALKGMKKGKLYDFRVRAVLGKSKGAWSAQKHRWFAKQANVKAASMKAGTVKVSWKENAKANAGYKVIVRYSKFGKVVATKYVANRKASTSVKGLRAGKKAWVIVRPLRKAGDTVYSGISKRAKAPVKVAS